MYHKPDLDAWTLRSTLDATNVVDFSVSHSLHELGLSAIVISMLTSCHTSHQQSYVRDALPQLLALHAGMGALVRFMCVSGH